MPKHVDFSFIRYANGWEDTQLLMDNLKPKAGDKVLSIAAGGDNSLAFLAFDTALVIAFDVNDTQLFLTELKQQSIKHLNYEDVLAFLGFKKSNQRDKLFQFIKPHLSVNCQNYFSQNIVLIQNGLIHQGKFENYFKLFRTYILPLIHTKQRIDELFKEKTEEEQLAFYTKKWNTWRWRALFKLFFSEFILGKFGRDPQFFKENKLPVSNTIFNAAQKHLSSTHVFKNHYLDYQLRGNFNVQLPFYLQEENYLKIKQNIDNLRLEKGYLTDIKYTQKFDLANLSNIFEYMNIDLFEKQIAHLKQCMNTDSKIAYWNLLVERKIEKIDPHFKCMDTTGFDLCFFYQSFHLNQYQI